MTDAPRRVPPAPFLLDTLGLLDAVGVPSLDDQLAFMMAMFPGCVHVGRLPFYPPPRRSFQYDVVVPKPAILQSLASADIELFEGMMRAAFIGMRRALPRVDNYFDHPGQQVDSLNGFDAGFLQLSPRTRSGLAACAERSPRSPFMRLRVALDPKHAACAPEDLPKLLAPDEFALDPATTGIILAMLIGMMRWKPEIEIDCPGAAFDPLGKGEGKDCPRWSLRPNYVKGDWNWARRARADTCVMVATTSTT